MDHICVKGRWILLGVMCDHVGCDVMGGCPGFAEWTDWMGLGHFRPGGGSGNSK